MDTRQVWYSDTCSVLVSSDNHLLKLVSRGHRYLTAASCQHLVYVAHQTHNMTAPLHNEFHIIAVVTQH